MELPSVFLKPGRLQPIPAIPVDAEAEYYDRARDMDEGRSKALKDMPENWTPTVVNMAEPEKTFYQRFCECICCCLPPINPEWFV